MYSNYIISSICISISYIVTKCWPIGIHETKQVLTLKLPQHSKSPNRKQLYLKASYTTSLCEKQFRVNCFLTSLPTSLSFQKNAIIWSRVQSDTERVSPDTKMFPTIFQKMPLRAIIWSMVQSDTE